MVTIKTRGATSPAPVYVFMTRCLHARDDCFMIDLKATKIGLTAEEQFREPRSISAREY